MYKWHIVLILKDTSNELGEMKTVLVVPNNCRKQIMSIAHNNLGHFSYKKTLAVIKRHFSWPNMLSDIKSFAESCLQCQCFNSGGVLHAPMVEHPIISVPHEQVAVDLVGPFPKGKGGIQYILTMVCMATRWPNAKPLHSISSKAIAYACVELFLENGISREILSDSGPQFSSATWDQVCNLLNIIQIHTSPYRLVLKHIHKTMKSSIKKALDKKRNWVAQISYVIFALRQIPNRSLRLSPNELVLGRSARTLLDALVDKWLKPSDRRLKVCQWVDELRKHLDSIRDTAAIQAADESEKRRLPITVLLSSVLSI